MIARDEAAYCTPQEKKIVSFSIVVSTSYLVTTFRAGRAVNRGDNWCPRVMMLRRRAKIDQGTGFSGLAGQMVRRKSRYDKGADRQKSEGDTLSLSVGLDKTGTTGRVKNVRP